MKGQHAMLHAVERGLHLKSNRTSEYPPGGTAKIVKCTMPPVGTVTSSWKSSPPPAVTINFSDFPPFMINGLPAARKTVQLNVAMTSGFISIGRDVFGRFVIAHSP